MTFVLVIGSHTTTMKLAVVTLALLPLVAPFAPRNHASSTTRLASTVAPPDRVAPDAGYVPEWEDRPGLSPEEFMESDMSKPDMSGMWECPLTRWDWEGYALFVFPLRTVVCPERSCSRFAHCFPFLYL